MSGDAHVPEVSGSGHGGEGEKMSVVDGVVKRPGFSHRPTSCRRAWAIISACGKYRYLLGRDVREDGITYPNPGYVLWVMLNPSTADASHDDNTIRRCVSFTRQWGYPELLVGNLYAYRSTDPANLWAADDPQGPENCDHLQGMARNAALIIAAWGRHAKRADSEPIAHTLATHGHQDIYCLGLNKHGFQPAHPLMLRADTQRVLFEPKPYRASLPSGPGVRI